MHAWKTLCVFLGNCVRLDPLLTTPLWSLTYRYAVVLERVRILAYVQQNGYSSGSQHTSLLYWTSCAFAPDCAAIACVFVFHRKVDFHRESRLSSNRTSWRACRTTTYPNKLELQCCLRLKVEERWRFQLSDGMVEGCLKVWMVSVVEMMINPLIFPS